MIKCLFFLYLILPCSLLAQPLLVGDSIRFLALGDSYTIGQSVGANERWPVQLSDSLATRGIVTDTMRIIATTGWRTDDLLNAINNQQLQQQHYNLVSLLVGVNNQYQGTPFSQYVIEFPALLDSAIRYAGGNKNHVFVVSIPDYAYTPFGQSTSNPSQISTELDHYNAYNKRVTDSMQIQYFDITPISRQGTTTPTYVTTDGLHPSGLQYSKWVKLMLDSIDHQVVVATGIKTADPKKLNISIWPNPANDAVTITISGENKAQISTIEIYNTIGQLIKTDILFESPTVISVKELQDGLYTLRVNSGTGYNITKLVKASEHN